MAKEKKEIIGQVFGQWTVSDKFIETKGSNGRAHKKWLCRCECGVERYVLQRSLTSGHSKSCGCHKHEDRLGRAMDLTGQVFGELTVIEKSAIQKKRYGTRWKCRCSCGNEYETIASLLVTGKRSHCNSKAHEKNYYYKDISGMKTGHLTVLYRAEGVSSINSSAIWHCRCECGNEIDLSLNELLYGNRSSCGCRKAEHGRELVLAQAQVDGTNIDNLRRGPQANNTSGHKGVAFAHNKYMAFIGFKKKKYYLGLYSDINEAIEVRKKAEELLFGSTIDYYELWKQKADTDPEWASNNPICINVIRDAENNFNVCFSPEL